MKEDIMFLLNSMSDEDIRFGIELAKANNLYNEIKEELLPLAMPEIEWCQKDNAYIAERRWCISSSLSTRIYRCTRWNDGTVIYFT